MTSATHKDLLHYQLAVATRLACPPPQLLRALPALFHWLVSITYPILSSVNRSSSCCCLLPTYWSPDTHTAVQVEVGVSTWALGRLGCRLQPDLDRQAAAPPTRRILSTASARLPVTALQQHLCMKGTRGWDLRAKPTNTEDQTSRYLATAISALKTAGPVAPSAKGMLAGLIERCSMLVRLARGTLMQLGPAVRVNAHLLSHHCFWGSARFAVFSLEGERRCWHASG